jgi:hypothetical protein
MGGRQAYGGTPEDVLHARIERLGVPAPKWGSGGRAFGSLRPDQVLVCAPSSLSCDAHRRGASDRLEGGTESGLVRGDQGPDRWPRASVGRPLAWRAGSRRAACRPGGSQKRWSDGSGNRSANAAAMQLAPSALRPQAESTTRRCGTSALAAHADPTSWLWA